MERTKFTAPRDNVCIKTQYKTSSLPGVIREKCDKKILWNKEIGGVEKSDSDNKGFFFL